MSVGYIIILIAVMSLYTVLIVYAVDRGVGILLQDLGERIDAFESRLANDHSQPDKPA